MGNEYLRSTVDVGLRWTALLALSAIRGPVVVVVVVTASSAIVSTPISTTWSILSIGSRYHRCYGFVSWSSQNKRCSFVPKENSAELVMNDIVNEGLERRQEERRKRRL